MTDGVRSRNALVGSKKRNRGKRNRGASCGMERRIAYWEIRCNMRARGQADAGAWETTNSNESITIGGGEVVKFCVCRVLFARAVLHKICFNCPANLVQNHQNRHLSKENPSGGR